MKKRSLCGVINPNSLIQKARGPLPQAGELGELPNKFGAPVPASSKLITPRSGEFLFPGKILIETQKNLDALEENFPDVDKGLLPLDNIQIK